MKVEQIYTGCLAQGAYYIESDGEAAIIDPLRETSPYIAKAKSNGTSIKYIFETHFHADFVSGHLDLAEKTGAKIVYGPEAETSYSKHLATDGEVFKLGKVTITVLHTPGHTPESTTYLLKDEAGEPYAIFSGDTLFIGDVGRPDLAQKKGHLTAEDLAEWLFDSLRNKIMPLPDHVLVYPAHGAGSACGKSMSKETWDTLGNQKQTNYALRADMTKEEFVKEVTEGLLPPPVYFSANAKLNKMGYESIDTVMARGAQVLSPDDFEKVANETQALLLDVRDKTTFVKGFIPNSIFIGLQGSFAPWVGALITDLKQPILLIAEQGKEEEAVKRLARVGYDNVVGHLAGGFDAWEKSGKEIDTVETIDVDTFATRYTADLKLLDVRKPGEYNAAHVTTGQSFPLDFINEKMSEVDSNNEYYLQCGSGYRSTIAASILRARGFDNLINVQGKFNDIAAGPIPTVTAACTLGGS